MDDKSIVTPPAEEIAKQEGSLESISPEIETTPSEANTVPLSDLMAVKDKAQRKEAKLKARIEELESEHVTKKTSSPDLETLKAKYSWVDADFLDDVASLIERKAEEKLAPVRNQQKAESFEKQWKALYTDQLAKAEWVDTSKVDPETIKILALAPQNRWTPVKDLIEKLYRVEPTGRATTENDMRPAMEVDIEKVDITKMSPAQKEKAMKNPKTRSELFAKMDALGR